MMIKRWRMKKIFLIIFLVILFFPLLTRALAYPLVPCGQDEDDPQSDYNETAACTLCHLFQLFKNVIDLFLFEIVPVLAILLIALGGFMYLFAYLNPEGTFLGTGGSNLIRRANQTFSAVVVGLIIIYGAWVFVGLFFWLIGVADWTNLLPAPGAIGGWWVINC